MAFCAFPLILKGKKTHVYTFYKNSNLEIVDEPESYVKILNQMPLQPFQVF